MSNSSSQTTLDNKLSTIDLSDDKKPSKNNISICLRIYKLLPSKIKNYFANAACFKNYAACSKCKEYFEKLNQNCKEALPLLSTQNKKEKEKKSISEQLDVFDKDKVIYEKDGDDYLL